MRISTQSIAVGGDGVHLPGGSDPHAARMRLPQALIGASAHSAAEAAAQLHAGADYVTVSPVFLTASKPGYGPAIGLDGLANSGRGGVGSGIGARRHHSAECRVFAAAPAPPGLPSWARLCVPPIRARPLRI